MDITMDQREAYSEVLEVLRHMEKQYVNKIPKQIIMFFYDNCRLDYDFSMTTTIENTNLKSQTLDLLSLLNITYWNKAQSKEEIFLKYGISKQLNSQLEKNNKFTKIDDVYTLEDDITINTNLPVPIGKADFIIRKALHYIKVIFIKLFAD